MLPYVLKENAGLSLRLVSMKVKSSNPQDMDPNFRSLNNTTSSIQTSYGQALPSENGGDYPSYVSSIACSLYLTNPVDIIFHDLY